MNATDRKDAKRLAWAQGVWQADQDEHCSHCDCALSSYTPGCVECWNRAGLSIDDEMEIGL